MACTMILFGSSRHRNGKISGNVAAGFVYSGLQSMAAEGAGGAAAAEALGGLLGVWGFLAARVRGEDDADGEKGGDERKMQMDEYRVAESLCL